MLRPSGVAIWLTGLSGAGKSTVATLLNNLLLTDGLQSYVLDGDNIRQGLSKDLGFDETDRSENIRRVAEVARLMVDAGLVVIVALISPFFSDRRMARSLFQRKEFFEVYINVPLEVVEGRDPKGLYKKARNGAITHFTGIDSPYEKPEHPDFVINTDCCSPEQAAESLLAFLRGQGIFESSRRKLWRGRSKRKKLNTEERL